MTDSASRPSVSKLLERCFSELLRTAPDSVLVDSPELVQVTTPSRPSVYFNTVATARFSAEEAARRVSEIVEGYRSRNLPFRWCLGPESLPPALFELVSRQKPDSMHVSDGLALDTAAFNRKRDPAISVEPLAHATIKDFVAAELAAWEDLLSEERRRSFESQALEALEKPELWRFFIARVDGEAVGTGRLRIFADRSAGYLAGGGVRPAFRKRGIYSELISARVELLKAQSIPIALVHALRASSSVICQAVGFEVRCGSAIAEFGSRRS